MNDLFDKAVNGSGADFLEAERTLRRTLYTAASAGADVLKRAAESADPLARLFGDVLEAGRATGGREYDEVEQYFESMPKHYARTALGYPRPQMVEGTFTQSYEGRVTKFISWRLAREPDAPAWRPRGSLAYLKAHEDPATTAAVLRYVVLCPLPQQREWATQVLKDFADPALGTKLAEAEAWAKSHNLPFPNELRGLRTGAL